MEFIVAVDGSDESERAIEHAASLIDADRDALVLVHVVNPDVYAQTPNEPVSALADANDLLVATVEDAEERGAQLLEHATDIASSHGIDAGTDLLYGNPATEIARYADDGEFDGVFVGHTGKSERAERVLGSVAKNLVERATCPVTVVR